MYFIDIKEEGKEIRGKGEESDDTTDNDVEQDITILNIFKCQNR